VLLIYIRFALRHRDVDGHIAMLLDMPSIAALRALLADYIARVAGDFAK
jgi:chemotaxis protein CheC